MSQRLSGSYKSLRLTPAYAITTGWPPHFPKLSALLGFRSSYPDLKDFVRAVRLWQQDHGGLVPDGVIGPRTWARLEPLVKAYAGDVPRGQYPDWLLRINNEIVAAGLRAVERSTRQALVALAEHRRGRQVLPPCRTPRSAEEELFAEMAKVAVQQRTDTDHPIEVSAAYMAHAARHTLRRVEVGSQMGLSAVPALHVGQVWPGTQGGQRVIVALQDSFDRKAQAMSVEVVFVVDSGRCYTQPLRGWAHDYATLLIARVTKDLAPLKTMLEVEAAFLAGALSSTNIGLGALGLAASVLQWWGNPRNREIMAALMAGYGVLMAAREQLQRVAPTLCDKVFDAALQRVLREIPGAAVRDPTTMATFVAQVIWTLGRAVVTRDFARGAEGLMLLGKWTLRVLQPALSLATATAGAAVKAVPGAAVAAAKQAGRDAVGQAQAMVQDFKEQGFVLALREAEAILEELRLKGPTLKPLLEQVKATLDRLMVAMANVG